jgi:hypothetical protein
VAIVDADLRQGLEQKATQRRKSKEQGHEQRDEPSAHKPGDEAPRGRQGEHAIGGGDQPPGKGDALRLIGVQQVVRGTFFQYGGELPR